MNSACNGINLLQAISTLYPDKPFSLSLEANERFVKFTITLILTDFSLPRTDAQFLLHGLISYILILLNMGRVQYN